MIAVANDPRIILFLFYFAQSLFTIPSACPRSFWTDFVLSVMPLILSVCSDKFKFIVSETASVS